VARIRIVPSALRIAAMCGAMVGALVVASSVLVLIDRGPGSAGGWVILAAGVLAMWLGVVGMVRIRPTERASRLSDRRRRTFRWVALCLVVPALAAPVVARLAAGPDVVWAWVAFAVFAPLFLAATVLAVLSVRD
jgi:hypothetical protein